MTALAQGTGCFKASGARANNEDVADVSGGTDLLGVPAAPPFFSHGGVLGAADGGHGVVTGDADIAADAFADVVKPAFFDFLRQEGIGDGGPRGTDHIHDALFDNPHHGVGRSIAANADDRLGREFFHTLDVGFLKAFFGEA